MSGVHLNLDQGIARIRFEDVVGRNAVTLDFCRAFARVTRQAVTDPDVKAILLSAKGRFFSVGGDLADMLAHVDTVRDHVQEMTDLFHVGIRHLHHAPVPVVVALHGMAAGGGMSIALAGDLIVAGKSGKFNSGYTRSGLTPDGGLSWLLPRLVGQVQAFRIMALNPTIGSEEALRLGLVSKVVEDADLDEEIEAMLAVLRAMPTGVLGTLKRLMHEGAGRSFEAQLDIEGEMIARRAENPETLAILRSFLSGG
ncbi:enoyl-CoA hydratase/isomerase family protein [Rhizorhabdus sp.]|jgi:2-(1,2-epoxy-1,2-dihydrophenyl)acetyl-CoA isomerase|uniref:enoyl-CoA hydratase/isomerase family protein n=1 Tax=Rhizorhabdus sp. TaxID=1968843 RepID=UPI001B7B04C8|nr:enoyl-CoA hydratase-related protein [Rhizorhabdus sp.]MBP8232556.1 enoyl-CoA hydratase/isomerase family protein [Rhizorhabdus sp.]